MLIIIYTQLVEEGVSLSGGVSALYKRKYLNGWIGNGVEQTF